MITKGRVYIAGKVTGEKYAECVKKFSSRAEILRAQGYEVVNPMEIVPEGTGWKDAMKLCISELMNCDAYYMLPDWRYSKGAKIELQLALALDLRNLNGKL
jgi:hypothetical protein